MGLSRDCSFGAVSKELGTENTTGIVTLDFFPFLSPHLGGPRSAGLLMRRRRVNGLRARF